VAEIIAQPWVSADVRLVRLAIGVGDGLATAVSPSQASAARVRISASVTEVEGYCFMRPCRQHPSS